HNLSSLVVEDRSNGYPRHYRLDLEFLTGGDYRTLANSYREIKSLELPVVVAAISEPAVEVDKGDPGLATASASDTRIGGGAIDPATKLAAEPSDTKETP